MASNEINFVLINFFEDFPPTLFAMFYRSIFSVDFNQSHGIMVKINQKNERKKIGLRYARDMKGG